MPKTKYVVCYVRKGMPAYRYETDSKPKAESLFSKLKRNGRNPTLTKI